MNLNDMRTLVRRDLHDEDAGNYRWVDNELDLHIAHALKEFSQALPLEQKATLATVAGSREVSIDSLTDRVMIKVVEYPTGQFPPGYQRFALWNDILTLLGMDVPDGSNCYIYYGKLHVLDYSNSTLPAQFEDLVTAGACGYAAVELAGYAINQINTGGSGVPADWSAWGKEKLSFFRSELKRLGKGNRVRVKQLYVPFDPPVSKSTDLGP
jgi:hypothetical protein